MVLYHSTLPICASIIREGPFRCQLRSSNPSQHGNPSWALPADGYEREIFLVIFSNTLECLVRKMKTQRTGRTKKRCHIRRVRKKLASSTARPCKSKGQIHADQPEGKQAFSSLILKNAQLLLYFVYLLLWSFDLYLLPIFLLEHSIYNMFHTMRISLLLSFCSFIIFAGRQGDITRVGMWAESKILFLPRGWSFRGHLNY